MIPPEAPLDPGLVVRHDEGLHYVIEGPAIRTDGYEALGTLGVDSVSYIQLEDGQKPAGTRYNKPEDEFRQHFTLVPNARAEDWRTS